LPKKFHRHRQSTATAHYEPYDRIQYTPNPTDTHQPFTQKKIKNGRPYQDRGGPAPAETSEAPGQGVHEPLRQPRRPLLHLVHRRLHLKVPLLPRDGLHHPLHPEADVLPAALERALPGAQRPDDGPDAAAVNLSSLLNEEETQTTRCDV
ncbi:hypothetical protein CI238_00287, partial [Colletotrichum incanum]